MDYIKCLGLFLLNPPYRTMPWKVSLHMLLFACLFWAFCYVLFCLRKVLTMQPWLSWHLLYTRKTLNSQRFIAFASTVLASIKTCTCTPSFSSIIKNFYINYKDFSEKHDYEIKMESLWSCFSFFVMVGQNLKGLWPTPVKWASERVSEIWQALPFSPISLCLAENC